MESKIVSKIIHTVGILAVLISIGSSGLCGSEDDVRVAIVKDVKSFRLTIRGKFDLKNIQDRKMYSSQNPVRNVKVSTTHAGIKMGTMSYAGNHFRLIPHRDAAVYINHRRFRGNIDIIKESSKKLLAVNNIDLEDYIKGVLYHEVSRRWTLEALKAQAVVSRTYALYRMEQNKTQDYDLTDDIFSQVYGGKSSERYRMSLAVERTQGQVLTYNGKILPAYYHATCGGKTEDAQELWNEDWPPLKGVICPFCKKSPHYRWKKNLRLKNIQDKLNDRGYHLGLIKEIQVLERDKSGRIKTLKIITRDNKEAPISGKDFRNIIGPNIIKSNNYKIKMKGYFIDLVGRGWGHGVGMCQWGANFMSREGFQYEDILKFYYPGAEIEQFNRKMSSS